MIWEAFKPDTEPRRTIHQEEPTTAEAVLDALRAARAPRAAGRQPRPKAGEEGASSRNRAGIY